MSKKGKIISYSIIAGVVVCLLVFIFVVMSVRSTKINFLYQTNLNSEQVTTELDSAGIMPYGKSVIFVNKQELEQKIEKVYPQLKVYSIEFEFPNVVKINCSERVGVFCLTVADKTYVVDSEFKVIAEATQSQKDSLTTLTFGAGVEPTNVGVSNILDFAYVKVCVDLFAFIASQNAGGLNQFNKLFSSVQIEQGYDNYGEHKKVEKLIFNTASSAKSIIFENVAVDMQQRFANLYQVAMNPEEYAENTIELSY